MIKDIDVAKKMVQIQSSATDRGIHYDMSFRKTKSLLEQKKCFFSKVIFDEHNIKTFDRLDNEKGYTDANVVACTSEMNSLKGKLKVSEIKQIYEALKRKKIL